MENVDYLENCYRWIIFEQILDPMGTINPVENASEIFFYFPNSGCHLKFCHKLRMSVISETVRVISSKFLDPLGTIHPGYNVSEKNLFSEL